jgi:hypothetical protein
MHLLIIQVFFPILNDRYLMTFFMSFLAKFFIVKGIKKAEIKKTKKRVFFKKGSG